MNAISVVADLHTPSRSGDADNAERKTVASRSIVTLKTSIARDLTSKASSLSVLKALAY